MITEAILNGFLSVTQFLLDILPSVPEMPSGILFALDTITSLISETIGLLAYIYTPVLLVFVFTLFVAVLAFDNIYKLVLFVSHKIRG